MSHDPAEPPIGRILPVDWARTMALLAMAIFHAGRDFEVLGLVPPGTTFGGLWDLSARAIASTFLALAGVSLWLAHSRRLRWRAFLRRFLILCAAAGAVSLATWLFMPAIWVRFGILHSIALASLLALPFLRLPWWIAAGVAAVILWIGPEARHPAFNDWWWLWSGLSTEVPPMMDYEPMIPWLAPMLIGVAVGKLGTQLGIWNRLAGFPRDPGRFAELAAWPGRHSLAVYLIHQPVLIAVIAGGAWIAFRV
ncbi:MAG: heparan-alpha-glucosaminide N-acetyltransferase [Pseudomonadota bacterium]